MIDLDWHDDQGKVFEHPSRFKVIFCGRRWGKTRGAISWLPWRLYERQKTLGWWVSPTYRQAKIAWRYFFILFRKTGIILSSNKAELTINLSGGKRLEFRSAEIPDNLRGEGIDELVLDEFASLAPNVWGEVLRPCLMDSKGEAVFIGTPNGMNWATDLFNRAQSGEDSEWSAWQFSTYSNPFIDKAEIKKVEAATPEAIVRQEIYAEPTQNASAVFRNVDDVSTLQPKEPIVNHRYVLGVDLGKYKDFTVLSVFDGLDQVYLERFNQIDWSLQEKRIVEVAIKYNRASVVVDSTGLGDVVYERLKRLGLRVSPFRFTADSKKELIDTLSVRLDKREIRLLNDAVQKNELRSYAYELTHGGRLRTNAPSGLHDDCVISVALGTFGQLESNQGIAEFYEDKTLAMVAGLPKAEQDIVQFQISQRQQKIAKIFHGGKA